MSLVENTLLLQKEPVVMMGHKGPIGRPPLNFEAIFIEERDMNEARGRSEIIEEESKLRNKKIKQAERLCAIGEWVSVINESREPLTLRDRVTMLPRGIMASLRKIGVEKRKEVVRTVGPKEIDSMSSWSKIFFGFCRFQVHLLNPSYSHPGGQEYIFVQIRMTPPKAKKSREVEYAIGFVTPEELGSLVSHLGHVSYLPGFSSRNISSGNGVPEGKTGL